MDAKDHLRRIAVLTHNIRGEIEREDSLVHDLHNPRLEPLWHHIRKLKEELKLLSNIAQQDDNKTLVVLLQYIHNDSKSLYHKIKRHHDEIVMLLKELERIMHTMFVKDRRSVSPLIRLAKTTRDELKSLLSEIKWMESHDNIIIKSLSEEYSHERTIRHNDMTLSYQLRLLDTANKKYQSLLEPIIIMGPQRFYHTVDRMMDYVLNMIYESNLTAVPHIHVFFGAVIRGAAASVSRDKNDITISVNIGALANAIASTNPRLLSSVIIHECQHIEDEIAEDSRNILFRDIRREAPACFAEMCHLGSIPYKYVEWFDHYSFPNHNMRFKSLREFARYASPPMHLEKAYHQYIVRATCTHMSWTMLLGALGLKYANLTDDNLARVLSLESAKDAIMRVLKDIKTNNANHFFKSYIRACNATGRLPFFDSTKI
ncbi:MAG: hypothetical protein ACMXYL_02585 [Candidatus Woesearchaeota archaeon]